MTNIRYRYNDYTKTHYLDVFGHANYKKGDDIVCSAVSILCYTLDKSLKKYADYADIQSKSFNGHYIIYADVLPERHNEIKNAFDTIMCGFELLADNYPENVNIITV